MYTKITALAERRPTVIYHRYKSKKNAEDEEKRPLGFRDRAW
jgi:hypothetical protein